MYRWQHALRIGVAKLVFLASGYAGIALLSRFLTTEEFGSYSVVMGVAALINMILINGTLQTVSRFVAAHPEQAGAVRRRRSETPEAEEAEERAKAA